MKKLISIGVAVALLAMVVLPVGVAAASPVPSTYSKIPFAIIGSGFYLAECLLNALVDADMLTGMDWLPALMEPIGDWTAGPLAWSVDMMAWGVALMGTIVDSLADFLNLPAGLDLGAILGDISDALKECWTPGGCNYTPFTGCPS